MARDSATTQPENHRRRKGIADHTSDMMFQRIPTRTSSKPILRGSSLKLRKAGANLEPHTQLLRLPPEIIQYIAALLPHTTAAIFTFTCTKIRSILGTQYWDIFNDDLRAREHLIGIWLSLPPTKPLPSKPHAIPGVPQKSKNTSSHTTFESHTHARTRQQCMLIPRGSSLENLQAFQTKLKPRRRLLELLSRDTPDLIRCGRCVILHSPGRKIPTIHQSDLRECEAADKRMGVDRLIYAGFTFPHVQFAMKLHRAGHETDDYLRCLEKRTKRKEISFRICNGEFYVRARYLFPLSLPPSCDNEEKGEKTRSTMSPHLIIRPSQSHICTHLSINNPEKSTAFTRSHGSGKQKKNIKSRRTLETYIQQILFGPRGPAELPNHTEAGTEKTIEKEIQQCKYCETEFLFSIETRVAKGNAPEDVKGKGKEKATAEREERVGILTKWMCLGTATTCVDEKWCRHFERDIFDSSSRANKGSGNGAGEVGNGKRVRWERGEIVRRFERASEGKSADRKGKGKMIA
ncbi:hypothetical protein PVAG01_01896 [Phlyctema vagabunda]|uniref:F-box domain-containing protein n=1 Tax=Phlyctema vagabunda TaxID=108571 RepID=A0ABR4PYE0_9HELO